VIRLVERIPRVLAIALALGLHAAVAAALVMGRDQDRPQPELSVEIEVVAAAPSELLESAPPDIAAAPEEAPEAQEVREGAAATMLSQDAAEVDEVDRVDEAAPVAEPITMAAVPPESAVVTEEKPKEKRTPEPKRKVAKKAAPMIAGSKERKPATRKGKALAANSGGEEAAANYRSVVLSRINAKKSAIAARLTSGAAGTVHITFSIGPSGNVSRSVIARSSGNAAIDAAARATMAGITFPPPPGGRFTATVPIRVN